MIDLQAQLRITRARLSPMSLQVGMTRCIFSTLVRWLLSIGQRKGLIGCYGACMRVVLPLSLFTGTWAMAFSMDPRSMAYWICEMT